jgi:hypothetical protein
MHLSARSALRCAPTLLSLLPIVIVKAGERAGADVATAVFAGSTYMATSRSGAACAIARQLVKAGCPDGPWQVVDQQGMVCLSGKSLHRLARLMVSHFRFVRWQPGSE